MTVDPRANLFRTGWRVDHLLSDAYVFGTATGEHIKSIRTAWNLACQRVGIRKLHFHDLRREFGRLLESSADLHDVQMFLGHTAVTTTSRYQQSTPDRLERALAKLEKSVRLAHHFTTRPRVLDGTSNPRSARGQIGDRKSCASCRLLILMTPGWRNWQTHRT
jgi:hypothetical protein